MGGSANIPSYEGNKGYSAYDASGNLIGGVTYDANGNMVYKAGKLSAEDQLYNEQLSNAAKIYTARAANTSLDDTDIAKESAEAYRKGLQTASDESYKNNLAAMREQLNAQGMAGSSMASGAYSRMAKNAATQAAANANTAAQYKSSLLAQQKASDSNMLQYLQNQLNTVYNRQYSNMANIAETANQANANNLSAYNARVNAALANYNTRDNVWSNYVSPLLSTGAYGLGSYFGSQKAGGNLTGGGTYAQ